MKMARLAMKVAQVHIKILEQSQRLPKKRELREAVLADEALSELLGFEKQKRTAQDKRIAEAHDLLMSASTKTVG